MEFNQKNTTKVAWLYGFIVGLSNLIGSVIPSSFTTPELQTLAMSGWTEYIESNTTIIIIVSSFCYIIPMLLCFLYYSVSIRKNLKKRFINMPIAYASLSMSGWIYYFLAEVVTLIIAGKHFNVPVKYILMTSLMYVTLECLFSFTLGFFIMETLHRRVFLPKFFPEGKISETPGLIKPSNRFLFTVFYISVSVFPICFIWFAYINLLHKHSEFADKTVLLYFIIILILDIVILIIFTHYYSTPLQKLQEGTERVKKGDYTGHVSIVSNDSFGELADTFNDMISSIDLNNKKLIAVQNSILTGMATMVESRDNSTGGHIKRTSDCVRIFVEFLRNQEGYENLSDAFCTNVIKAAPMHDLGKIAVPDAILQKPGKFTDEEYEKMKQHSAEGARIVGEVLKEVDDEEFKKIAVNVAHYHHEKWNGTGYPEKLSGEEIPFEARIMALADVFDALVSKRCYKESFSFDKAFEIIKESSGSHFDPSLAQKFLLCRDRLEDLYLRF